MCATWRETTIDGGEVMAYKLWEDIGLNITKFREAKNWSRKQLAEAMRVPESRIKRYEYAESKVHLDVLKELSKYLDVSINRLIGAKPDSLCGKCLYKVWVTGDEDFKLIIPSTSARMAFFEVDNRVRLCGRRYMRPGKHACVKLVAVPVDDNAIREHFGGTPSDEEPV